MRSFQRFISQLPSLTKLAGWWLIIAKKKYTNEDFCKVVLFSIYLFSKPLHSAPINRIQKTIIVQYFRTKFSLGHFSQALKDSINFMQETLFHFGRKIKETKLAMSLIKITAHPSFTRLIKIISRINRTH